MKKLINANEAVKLAAQSMREKTIIERANDAITAAARVGKYSAIIFTDDINDILLLQKELKKKNYLFSSGVIVHEKTPYNWVREYCVRIKWL